MGGDGLFPGEYYDQIAALMDTGLKAFYLQAWYFNVIISRCYHLHTIVGKIIFFRNIVLSPVISQYMNFILVGLLLIVCSAVTTVSIECSVVTKLPIHIFFRNALLVPPRVPIALRMQSQKP